MTFHCSNEIRKAKLLASMLSTEKSISISLNEKTTLWKSTECRNVILYTFTSSLNEPLSQSGHSPEDYCYRQKRPVDFLLLIL